MMSVLVAHAGRLMAVRGKLVLLAAAALFAGWSANCMEYKAWEAELAYLRADYEGNVPGGWFAQCRSCAGLVAIAGDVIRFSSDKYWTAEYGYRTPQTFFGKMSPERNTENVETMSLDALL